MTKDNKKIATLQKCKVAKVQLVSARNTSQQSLYLITQCYSSTTNSNVIGSFSSSSML